MTATERSFELGGGDATSVDKRNDPNSVTSSDDLTQSLSLTRFYEEGDEIVGAVYQDTRGTVEVSDREDDTTLESVRV
ncbi:hypothetical protein C494_20283 [Natronorubrum bangense JCM 10635]|uniref:Uncharacterized protein n=1 Tax=Natronorubrum bangense JCM 10635 TaxID=1227500 RepID=L9W030_9EURY|nr:hypothetical protein C494_20283 [Natronorubrum bangense JCM 10635]